MTNQSFQSYATVFVGKEIFNSFVLSQSTSTSSASTSHANEEREGRLGGSGYWRPSRELCSGL